MMIEVPTSRWVEMVLPKVTSCVEWFVLEFQDLRREWVVNWRVGERVVMAIKVNSLSHWAI